VDPCARGAGARWRRTAARRRSAPAAAHTPPAGTAQAAAKTTRRNRTRVPCVNCFFNSPGIHHVKCSDACTSSLIASLYEITSMIGRVYFGYFIGLLHGVAYARAAHDLPGVLLESREAAHVRDCAWRACQRSIQSFHAALLIAHQRQRWTGDDGEENAHNTRGPWSQATQHSKSDSTLPAWGWSHPSTF
jgi:hypothetical protein